MCAAPLDVGPSAHHIQVQISETVLQLSDMFIIMDSTGAVIIVYKRRTWVVSTKLLNFS